MSADNMNAFVSHFCEILNRPRALGSTSYEPVFYACFEPRRILELQQTVEVLKSQLVARGHTVVEFNCYDKLWEILEANPFWSEICEFDRESPMDWSNLQETLTELVCGEDDLLVEALRATLKSAENENNPIIFVTGLEALHGYLRPGHLENRLNGSFGAPTVFFYPGRIEGKTGLRFLNFYSLDANYRSEHIAVPEN